MLHRSIFQSIIGLGHLKKSNLYALGVFLLQLLIAKSREILTYPVERPTEKGNFSEVFYQNIKDWLVEEAQKLCELALTEGKSILRDSCVARNSEIERSCRNPY